MWYKNWMQVFVCISFNFLQDDVHEVLKLQYYLQYVSIASLNVWLCCFRRFCMIEISRYWQNTVKHYFWNEIVIYAVSEKWPIVGYFVHSFHKFKHIVVFLARNVVKVVQS